MFCGCVGPFGRSKCWCSSACDLFLCQSCWSYLQRIWIPTWICCKFLLIHREGPDLLESEFHEQIRIFRLGQPSPLHMPDPSMLQLKLLQLCNNTLPHSSNTLMPPQSPLPKRSVTFYQFRTEVENHKHFKNLFVYFIMKKGRLCSPSSPSTISRSC